MNLNNENSLGIAGFIAKIFINSKLTPVIGILSIFIGIISIYLTPKEEEPQISVPMIDILAIAENINSSKEVERKLTEPIERAVWGLEGVEYVYSSSLPQQSLVTVRFKVGEPIEPSLVKVHHKIMELKNSLNNMISNPVIKSHSIDDVPFLAITFSSNKYNDYELRTRIAPLARELSATPDLNKVEFLGGQKRAIRVIVDNNKLASNGVTLNQVARALLNNDSLKPAGKNWSNKEIFDIEVGNHFKNTQDIEHTAIGQRGGSVILIKDVAEVIDGPEEKIRQSLLIENKNPTEIQQAVSLSFSKRKGTNIVTLSKELIAKAELFSNSLPKEIKMSIIRDYGTTAADKTHELIEHLIIATLSVSALIAIFMGLRASLVVAIAIPVTLSLTLAIYYFMGYTLNRVTLFALIFSIGILVDDAIVVVENIERHLKNNQSNLYQATISAVKEVGNPTILATFTVIAAILPMAFVQGMMGPYMKPIPVGASLAMIISLFVAFIITPWASNKILKKHTYSDINETEKSVSYLDKIYLNVIEKFLKNKKNALVFFGICFLFLLTSISLFYFKNVKVKMLPFDNKNEFQITIDYPTHFPLEKSIESSVQLAKQLVKDNNLEKIQIFSGEAAPFSFSGMVKHTYLRKSDYQTDLHIVLKNKGDRKKSSHEIIEKLRKDIQNFSSIHNAVTKILEIPPGPPVLATLVAEIYAPNEVAREQAANEVFKVFANEPSVVDLDTSLRPLRKRIIYEYNQIKGGSIGTNASDISKIGNYLFSESQLLTLYDPKSPEEISIDFSVQQKIRSNQNPFKNIFVSTFETGTAEVSNVLNKPYQNQTNVLHRKNLKPVVYVTSELAGSEEAPVYGIQKLSKNISYQIQTVDVPWNINAPIVKWDGEWFITYEVFRDLGGAFAIVLVLIYVLVLAWFKSYSVPLVIMAPIPISLIGIIPGHFIFSSYFTATSMIGFIAGAGIIVRNSIILIDFIENQLAMGKPLRDSVINAGLLRFRPMLLTAAAVIVGSFVILFDPIFQGLAISLMFGEVAATLIGRFAVPVLYYWLVGQHRLSLFTREIN